MIAERPSVCPLDCPDTCSLTVTVEDDRVVKVRGSRANPLTAGVLCTKVQTLYPDFVHGPGRLTTPLRRVGLKGEGRFERITWEEALDLIHTRVTAAVAAHGPQTVLPLNYAGPHGMLAYASMDLRFFHRLGATLLDRKPLCGGIRTEAWTGTYGTVPGIRPEQAAHSKLIIVWGNNVTWSNLHFMPIVNQAKRSGAKIVVIDPKRIKISEQADLHIALRPGTDVVLAWAVAAELERRGALDHGFIERHVQGFDEFMARARHYPPAEAARICGVPESQIQTLAEWYATLTPAAISVGNGLERNQNGGSGIRAIFALPALAGRWGVPGAGCINGAGFAFPKTPQRLQRPDLVPPGTRTLNIVDVGGHLLDEALSPPITAVFIYNHNPVIVHPDQNRMKRGLAREDLFAVGIDVVMTDSLAYCDVVQHRDLPPAREALRLHRAALHGQRRRADGRGHGRHRRAAGRPQAEPHRDRSRPAHADPGRGGHPLQEHQARDALGQGRARLELSRAEVRRAAAGLPAVRGPLSPRPHHARLGQADHLDLRRAGGERCDAAPRDASGRRAGARPQERHDGARLERSG